MKRLIENVVERRREIFQKKLVINAALRLSAHSSSEKLCQFKLTLNLAQSRFEISEMYIQAFEKKEKKSRRWDRRNEVKWQTEIKG